MFKVGLLYLNESLIPWVGLNLTVKMKLLIISKENVIIVVEDVNNDLIDKYPAVSSRSLGKYISKLILHLSLFSS